MQITRTEEYGIRLAMRLARSRDRLTVAELAELERIPAPTVAKVLHHLRRGGIVRAERGRNGGFVLSDAPERISVGSVLGTLGEPLFAGRFCTGEAWCDCPSQDECGLRPVWCHIDRMIGRVLEGTTLKDLLDGERSMERHVRGLWPVEAAPESEDGGRRTGTVRTERENSR